MSECPSRAMGGKGKDRRDVNGVDEEKEAKRFSERRLAFIDL